ncbi:MAG: glycosyltransferase [Gemmatimonadota bacterium]
MKICDLTQSYANTGGGVRTYLHAKRRHLLDHTAHDHVLIVPGAEDARTRDGRSTTYRIASPPVPRSPNYRLLLRSDKVLRILDRERPDVIEVHDTYNLPWTALWHRRKHSTAVIGFSMTDLGSAYVEPGVRRLLGSAAGRAARRLADRYTRALYGRCDATVAISAVMAADLRVRGVAETHWVPLGVDTERFRPADDPAPVRDRYGVRPEELLLVYAGRLDSEKRPDVVVDAFERLPTDFPAVLVLAGDGSLRTRLEARGDRDRRIHVLPFIQDRDELAALLGAADLYVSAMPFETFGLAVVEAQACGLPVLGVRSGAMTERVTEGETGRLVPPDDPAALAEGIRALEAERERLRAMGRAARRHVEENFSWHRTFEALLGLYQAVGSPGGAR